MSQENEPHGEVYSPIMDEEGFDARDVGGPRAWLLFLGFVAALIIVALILLFAYGGGTRGPDEPPEIRADNSPYKSAPADPGGEQAPNQNISVYESGREGEEVVTITPDSETPVTLETAPDTVDVQIRGQDPIAEPVETPAIEAPVVTTPKPAVPAPTATTSAYYVQISALRSDAEARAGWTAFSKKHADLIPAGSGFNINRVDRGDRGIFYQLRVSGFGSKDSAQSFCDRLKSRGQDCLVVRG